MGKNVNNTLPNFMILGGMRCGTTVLYKILKKHPEIYLSNTKEPHFFDIPKRYNKGMGYYKSYFKLDKKYKMIGEATASYLRHGIFTANKIKKVLPNTKFIVLLRNPINRTFSHYFFHQAFKRKIRQKKCIYKSIEDMIKNTNFNSTVFRDSIYYKQLQEWFKHFPKRQFLIIKSENFFQYPKAILKKIMEFLKVKQIDLDLSVDRVNTTTKNRTLGKKTRNQLQEYFKDYNNKLYSLLETNFNWR